MISDWSTRFNIQVVRCEDRPDRPQGNTVYRLIDLFTTNSGSWEPSDKLGAVTAWARDKYLRPLGAADFFDDAGADHHLFARVLDASGQPIVANELIRFWSDGLERLGDPAYRSYVHATPKQHSGWANQPVFNSFSPERGERGAWCWCPEGAADVVVGGGLPNNQHVSFFAVWQAQPRPAQTHEAGQEQGQEESSAGSGMRERPSESTQTQPPALDAENIRRRIWQRAEVSYDRASFLINYARMHNLGAPLTPEIEVDGFRVQGFANGIAYAPLGQADRVSHMGW